MWSRRFRALGLEVEVGVEDAALVPAIDALTVGYEAATGRAGRHYRLGAGRLSADGEELYATADGRDLVAAFELDLYRRATEAEDDWLLHAAAIAFGERGLVLAGPSGNGKSTLAHALLGRGATYLTDEVAALGPGARLRGLRRPVNFDAPPAHAIGRTDVLSVAAPGGERRVFLIQPPPALPGEVRAVALVHLRYAPAQPPELRRLSPGEALARLWAETLNCTDTRLALASGLVEQLPTYALSTRAIDEACATLETLAAQ